jgi:hypothetical protein
LGRRQISFVEGVSDLLYLPSVSGVLDSKKREALSEDWTITPVGGSDKVPTFVSLLGSQKRLKLATLIVATGRQLTDFVTPVFICFSHLRSHIYQ